MSPPTTMEQPAKDVPPEDYIMPTPEEVGTIDPDDVIKFWKLLRHHTQTEFRLVNQYEKDKNKKVKKFYFNTEEELINICKKYNGQFNLYLGINERKIGGSHQHEVLRVGIIPFDIDCTVKPASQEDLQLAKVIAEKIIADLSAQGFCKPTYVLSGNGYQLYYVVPLLELNEKNRDVVEAKIEDFGKEMILRYSTDKVRLDNIYDLPRIMRIPGTFNMKSKTRSQIMSFKDEEDAKFLDYILNRPAVEKEAEKLYQEERAVMNKVTSSMTIDDLDVVDVWGTVGLEMQNGEYRGSHPIHGSTTGENFNLNPTKNTWHCFRCLVNNSKVVTPLGIKNIQDLKRGEYVYGENYQRNNIVNTFSRNSREVIYELKSYVPSIFITQDHPLKIATIKYQGKHLQKLNPIISWKTPSEINTNKDFLIIPKKHIATNYFNLNDEIGELLGWYIADGHLGKSKKGKNKNNIQITIGINATNKGESTAQRLCKLSKKYFDDSSSNYYIYPKRGTILISIYSQKLRIFIENTIGTGSSKKQIGKLIQAPLPFLSSLVYHYVRADGGLSCNKQQQRISSASEMLIREVQIILFKLGIPARYYYSSEENNIKAKNPKHLLQWTISPIHKSEFQDKNNLYIPFKLIRTSRKERVYNIETKDNTYLLPFITHNCNSGGGPLSAIAVKEGIIQCGDARPGIIRGKTAREAIKHAEEKYGLVKQQPAKIFGLAAQTQQFTQQQPIFYDKSGLWWLWDDKLKYWVICDEVDILNMINAATGADIVTSKSRTEILNSLKQEGRKKIPDKASRDWVQFKNGIVDIKNGKIILPDPKFFVTNPIPWNMGDKEDTPNMDRIFEQWVGKDLVPLLYEILSFALLCDYPVNRIFCFVGAGLNGKSKFLELLKKFVGEKNCCATELDVLLNSRFEITRLYRKLICQMGETDFSELHKTSVLKKLTGGDLIGFEYKNKNPFEETNYAKIIISTNNLPATNDKTIGFYRRWLIIDFPNQFTEKIDILSQIPDEEYENLARKSLKILRELLNKREFYKEGSIEERMKRYEDRSNPFDKFWAECIEEDVVDAHISKKKFSEALNTWCRANKFRELSDVRIAEKMKERRIPDEKMTMMWADTQGGPKPRYYAWVGIRFKDAYKGDKSN